MIRRYSLNFVGNGKKILNVLKAERKFKVFVGPLKINS